MSGWHRCLRDVFPPEGCQRGFLKRQTRCVQHPAFGATHKGFRVQHQIHRFQRWQGSSLWIDVNAGPSNPRTAQGRGDEGGQRAAEARSASGGGDRGSRAAGTPRMGSLVGVHPPPEGARLRGLRGTGGAPEHWFVGHRADGQEAANKQGEGELGAPARHQGHAAARRNKVGSVTLGSARTFFSASQIRSGHNRASIRRYIARARIAILMRRFR